MIVHLVGPPASGKTTFARWFLDKHPFWQYIAIDEIRNYYAKTLKNCRSTEIEKIVFDKLLIRLNLATDSILETTGTIWRLKDTWNLVNQKSIYTIKFTDTTQNLLIRAKNRVREVVYPYNIKDEEVIEEENNIFVPANLIVRNSTTANKEIYSQIEWYILKSRIILDKCVTHVKE